ncbi:unnamed protein product [Cyprideis torosa]|uniref:Probable D-lactate dehydrogenase, mitochondrial n=1 Tax=Cyprideis torosa TaxID=163714 RepID=A0A7R8W5Z3_9CRUS|nr:unnamed protein product [Cyprideis torosa]CAG0885807.1 unnamed protein product [Cyprideis torosa]
MIDHIAMMVKVLEYLECPQYLRKRFFPLSADLRFAGLLNPLDCGHHLRGDNREALYREGVVLAEDDEMLEGEGAAPEGKSYVYVGLPQKVLVNYAVMPNVRVTVKLLDNDGRRGKLVSPGEPTKETGSYWGYRVRAAESLKEVLKGAKYDVKIGTSDKGECCETAWKRLKWETNKKGSAVASCRVIMVFGGLSGLEAAVSSDTDSVASLFDVYVNTCSNQGSGGSRVPDQLGFVFRIRLTEREIMFFRVASRSVVSSSFLRYSPSVVQSRNCSLKEVHEKVQAILPALTSILGHEHVSTSDVVREQHGKDEGPFNTRPAPPDVVVWPPSVEHVSEVMKLCYKSDIPMIPFGTGTGLEGGVCALQGGVCLNLTKMDQVMECNMEDFDVTVQPGVTRDGLNHYVRDHGLWFPVDPGADASLCGMCATSASGTNAVRYGTMRENVINLEVVLADGTIVEAAGKGRRTKKTAAGYNLTNLFVGSEGTLGVITAATLRLHALPEAMIAAVCSFPTVQAAVDTTVQVLQTNIPIARIEFLDDKSIEACNKFSHTSYPATSTLFMEFHGAPNEVEAHAKATEEICGWNEGSDFSWAKAQEDRHHLWKARHDLYYASLAMKPGSRCVITDVAVPISKLPDMIMGAKEDIEKSGIVGNCFGHVGDGNFHAMLIFDPEHESDYQAVKGVGKLIAERALTMSGTCTGEHGIGIGKIPYLLKEVGPETLGAMKLIKQALDPKGLMNPGKIF